MDLTLDLCTLAVCCHVQKNTHIGLIDWYRSGASLQGIGSSSKSSCPAPYGTWPYVEKELARLDRPVKYPEKATQLAGLLYFESGLNEMAFLGVGFGFRLAGGSQASILTNSHSPSGRGGSKATFSSWGISTCVGRVYRSRSRDLWTNFKQ